MNAAAETPLPPLFPPTPHAPDAFEGVAVIGAGAAGLFAAIWAARSLRESGAGARVVALDGARTLGAKILVAGGGRCNVTHHAVDESAYAGSTRNAIKKVLRRFDVPETVRFFAELGVNLKREETGKLFPTSDSARSVLDALIRAAGQSGAHLLHPWRVERVTSVPGGFEVVERVPTDQVPPRILRARRVVLATGGKSLPKTGSDGHGYAIASSLGHSITPEVFPALVPLTLDLNRTFVHTLSGLTLPATIDLWSGTGKRLASFTNSTLFTHFGLSGPGVLDISRYYTAARLTDPAATLTLNLLPGRTFEDAERELSGPARTSILRRLADALPERLARALCDHLRIEPGTTLANLRRDDRRSLAHAITRLPLPVTGDRGFAHAEVTAGGVPLNEIHLETMESRVCPGLHLCGEICDVDGRIGGFNFQWAWASGFVAGSAAASPLLTAPARF